MSESAKPEVSKLQSQNKLLENQLAAYRQRLKDLSEILPKSELERILQRYALRDILELPQQENGDLTNANGSNTPDLGIDVSSPNNDDHLMLIETSDNNHSFAPIVPPRNLQSQISSTLDALKPSVGTKLEGLLLNSDSDSDFDPRADENDTIPSEKHSDSFFGFEPPKATIGQQLFAANAMNGNGINTNGVSTNGTINSSSPPLRKFFNSYFPFWHISLIENFCFFQLLHHQKRQSLVAMEAQMPAIKICLDRRRSMLQFNRVRLT